MSNVVFAKGVSSLSSKMSVYYVLRPLLVMGHRSPVTRHRVIKYMRALCKTTVVFVRAEGSFAGIVG